MKRSHLIYCLVLLVVVMIPNTAEAQKRKKKNKTNTETAAPKPSSKTKEISEVVKTSKKLEGLFDLYQDSITGATYLLIKKNQLDKEFIHFSQISNGVMDAGRINKGRYNAPIVFKISKHFNRIEFTAVNNSFYFDPENPLSRSKGSNMSDAIMASLSIEAADDKAGEYLIKGDELFLQEIFGQIKPPNFPGSSPMSFKLGSLDKNKTKVAQLKNYPENTDIEVEYVYSNPSALNKGSEALSDGRFVSIKVYNSIIPVPENDYQPRFDDPRVGYFTTQVTDMTSSEATPFRDLVHRWHLKKKNPEASISDPVEPIVWWIENTTPYEFRETIQEAVLEWNKAFEAAGISNAMQVKIQPDDADWDAGDIRYNVLRWTSSPRPPFGGYGPSFVNPKTGQILGADIMLEFVYHTNRVKYNNIYPRAMEHLNEYERIEDAIAYCSFGEHYQMNTLFGKAAMLAFGKSDLEMEGMKKEAMKELIMHEVGHTLGLNHNMKASQLFSVEELNNPEFIKGKALTGSVMDYTAINVSNDPAKQGHYYSTTVGPYDVWAIQFAYQNFDSALALKQHLDQSTKPELTFGNDADDMRSPGKAIDPRVNTGDLSNDQITYSINRIQLVNDLIPELKTRFLKPNQSYQELKQSYNILMGQYNQAGSVLSRFIGGVYVDRAMYAQPNAKQAYTPVELEKQKAAMDAIRTYIFAPDAFQVPSDIYNYLADQRRGFNFFGGPEDPKIHEQVLNYQKNVLNHLVHYNTLQRILDSEQYGNKYSLDAMMSDLNEAIFAADIKSNPNSFRRNLQVEYTDMLIDGLIGRSASNYSNHAHAMMIYNLKQIRDWVAVNSGNTATKAHKLLLKTKIDNALDELK